MIPTTRMKNHARVITIREIEWNEVIKIKTGPRTHDRDLRSEDF